MLTLIFVLVDVYTNTSCCSACVLSVLVPVLESIIVNWFPAWSTCVSKLSVMRLADKDVVWPLFYSTSYIRESRIGLSFATPIVLTFASFNIFLTLVNSGPSTPQSNVNSILTYCSYELDVQQSSALLTSGLLNTLLNSSLKY